MKKLSPSQKLKIRKAVFERDKWCVFCGNPFNLTPAHIIRASQGGEYTEENLMAACIMTQDNGIGCHTKFDAYQIEIPWKVWNRMTEKHKEAYLKTRRTHEEKTITTDY